MKKIYSYGKQTITQEDINEVIKILKGDWLTQGPTVELFEKALKDKFKCKYVSVVANGTAALHLTAIALGWNQNDIIITSPMTFVASANCILYVDSIPDFVDIDPMTYTIDVDLLETKLRKYRSENKRVRAVIAVDYAGHPCDWKSLRYLADKYAFELVNDNCHAMGAEINGDMTYAAKYADVVIMSFHPVKHITTGEGGAVLTNNEEVYKKINILRTHGIIKDENLLEKNEGPWYYEMHYLGFNYRITDLQCALGISQLKRLDSFIGKRRMIAEYYNNVFCKDERIIIPYVSQNIKHAYHLYPLQIKFTDFKISKRDFFLKMKENNINLQVHYIPVHLQPFYRKNFGFREGDYPIAEKYYEREVSIPIYPELSDLDLNYISEMILRTLNKMK
jgi:UDP-4-amino-4,6-dideoxy-N-acetyl-beta-L-altrosamine transaminase